MNGRKKKKPYLKVLRPIHQQLMPDMLVSRGETFTLKKMIQFARYVR